MKQRTSQGFTLIELMVVVAVVGILSAIAYPSYQDSVLKGRRAQARAALAELLQQQERYMTQRNCYLGFTTTKDGTATATATAPSPITACGGVTATAVPFKTYTGEGLPTAAAYTLWADTCPAASGDTPQSIGECVRVNASPVRADPAGDILRITSTGTKDCTGTASTTNPALCWP